MMYFTLIFLHYTHNILILNTSFDEIFLMSDNGLYGYGADSGSGTYFENTIVVQYDPQVQEVWDQARKLRCTWHDQYEKSVTFRSVQFLDDFLVHIQMNEFLDSCTIV